MLISLVNHTDITVADEDVQAAARAINRQLQEDFRPYWGIDAIVRLEGRSGLQPDRQTTSELRGDAVIYLWNGMDVPGALGYHDQNNRGIPFGFVFTDLAAELGEPWSVTLSHEVLELVADPYVNLLVAGPHPAQNRDVFHWYEMCDAVQAETYKIDAVDVSNFLLPAYFTIGEQSAARNDYLGRSHNGRTLASFGINPGGYVGFFDPQTNGHETYSIRGDAISAARMDAKSKAGEARRVIRYQEIQPAAELELTAASAEAAYGAEPRDDYAPVGS